MPETKVRVKRAHHSPHVALSGFRADFKKLEKVSADESLRRHAPVMRTRVMNGVLELTGNDAKSASEWLRTRLKALNNKTPLMLIETGKGDIVESLLASLRNGFIG